VSVPWVITMPSTFGCASRALTRLASTSHCSLPMFSLAIWNTCSPLTWATFCSSGTALISACTPTVAAV
jgi:hypothetical protein